MPNYCAHTICRTTAPCRYGAPGTADADTIGAPFYGACDGCESGRPQTVRTVRGEWGVATVCRWHEDNA